MQYDVIVIGAGQAGLASAHALQKAGLRYVVLEAGERAAGSWPSYYDSLTLFSPARYSSLPGLPFPGDPDRYPLKQEVIDYLESYARHFALTISYGAKVTKVERHGDEFAVLTETGMRWHARAVIVASGPFNQPNIPDFPGLADFKGQVLHSSAYRRPADIGGQKVAVVGAGNSAAQIAYELAQSHEVILTSRQPPHFIRQRILGRDIHFWLRLTGYDNVPLGHWHRASKSVPVLDTGRYQAALADGRVVWKSLFERLDEQGARWGEELVTIDTLLLATGFRHQPPFLEGLAGLDAATAAQQEGGISSHVPGLYFVGVSWQRAHDSATLRGVGADARHVVKHIQRLLKPQRFHFHRLAGCC